MSDGDGVCVVIELVADVDKIVDEGDVDVVDGGDIEDGGFVFLFAGR